MSYKLSKDNLSLVQIGEKEEFAIFYSVLQKLKEIEEIDTSVFSSMMHKEVVDIGEFSFSSSNGFPFLSYYGSTEVDNEMVDYQLVLGYNENKVSSIEIRVYVEGPIQIHFGQFHSRKDLQPILTCFVGNTKLLISGLWFHRMQLEELSFQSNTVSNYGCNIGTVYEMLKLLGVEK